MIYLDLPNINTGGTVEEQLAEIRSYIYKNNEQMNATLANLTTDKFWENTANAVSSASSKDETPRLLSQYAKIRDLIIKTATEVTKTEEHYSMLLSGSYLAKSQFGEYLKNTSVEINGTPTGFTELYRYSTDLGSDYAELNSVKLDYENYIKRGLLDDTGATPIYGIELGILKNKVVVDGVEHDFNTAYRTRITPDRWSFLYNNSGNDSEVAYITANTIHFPSADISGGSIDIGNGAFKVTSAGVMTATAGTFSGTLAASSLTTAFNGYTNSKIMLNSDSIDFIDSSDEKDFSLRRDGINFYKRDTVDNVMSKIERIKYSKVQGFTPYGLSIRLYNSYSNFFSIREDSKHVFAYIPAPPTSSATSHIMFSGVPGFHFDSSVDFHNNVIKNAIAENINLRTGINVEGHAGVTEHVIIKTCKQNSNGGYDEYYSDLYIRSGIITGISVP